MSGVNLLSGGLVAVGLVAASAGDAVAQYVVRGGPTYSRSFVTPSGGVVTKTYTPGFGSPFYGPGYGSPFYGPGFGYPAYYTRPAFVYPGNGGFYGPGYGGLYGPGFTTGGFQYVRPGFSIGVGFGRGW